MKVLVVRQDKLGDVVLTTPLVDSLADDHEVALWVQTPFVPIVGADAATPFRLSPWQIAVQALRLRRQRFDAAILAKANSRTHTALAKLAGIPVRVGITDKPYGEKLTRNVTDLPEDLHEVLRLARLAEHAVQRPIDVDRPLRLTIPPSHFSHDGPFVAYHAGTGGTSELWPAERHAEALRLIHLATGLPAVLTGISAERERAEMVLRESRSPGRVVAGETDVAGLAGVLRAARLVIAGNTASVHIAAAMGTPTVMIETTPVARDRALRWKPWRVPSRLVYGDGHDSITPGDVARAGKDLFEETE